MVRGGRAEIKSGETGEKAAAGFLLHVFRDLASSVFEMPVVLRPTGIFFGRSGFPTSACRPPFSDRFEVCKAICNHKSAIANPEIRKNRIESEKAGQKRDQNYRELKKNLQIGIFSGIIPALKWYDNCNMQFVKKKETRHEDIDSNSDSASVFSPAGR